MKLYPIVVQLIQYLPNFTNRFSSYLDIDTISSNSGIVTVRTLEPHNLSVNNSIVMTNCVGLVEIISATLDTNTNQVTIETLTDHNLSSNFDFKTFKVTPDVYVYIENSSDPQYNGQFKIVSIINRTSFIYQLPNTPSQNPPSDGDILSYAYNDYNGPKLVSNVIDVNTFEYEAINTLPETATAGKVHYGWRISCAISIEKAIESYTKSTYNIPDPNSNENYWLFVVPNGEVTSKSRFILNDSTFTEQRSGEEYRLRLIDTLNIFAFIPAIDDISGAKSFDTSEEIKRNIFKTILRFPAFPQYDTGDIGSFVYYFEGSNIALYNKSYLVMQYIFSVNYDLTYYDTFINQIFTPLKQIDGTSIIYDSEIKWNIEE